MSWTKNPKSFAADLVIHGKERGVAFDGDSLMIVGLTASEAMAVVDSLLGPSTGVNQTPITGSLTTPLDTGTVRVHDAGAANEATQVAAPGSDTVGPPVTAPAPRKRGRPPKVRAEVVNTESVEEGSHTVEKALAQPAPAPKPEPAPEPEPDPEEDKEPAKPEPTKVKVPGNGTTDTSGDAAHVAKLSTLSKIGEVVSYLHDSGLHSVTEKLALCGRIKGQVPVLSRVPNLDERISRAQEVLGLDG